MAGTGAKLLRTAAIAVLAVVSVAVTPQLALAFYPAYGTPIVEVPPPWLAAVDWPAFIAFDDPVAVYHAYGSVWALALAAVVALVATLLPPLQPARQGVALGAAIGAWGVVGGLALVAIGALLEYAVAYFFEPAVIGFALELLGFLAIAAAPLFGAVVARMRGELSTGATVIWAPVGVVAMVVGVAVVGHLPSGPALVPIVVVAIAAIVVTWRRPADVAAAQVS